jgi:hypothetical protein
MALDEQDRRWIQTAMAEQIAKVVNLVTEMKESLEREIKASEGRVVERLDQVEARLDVQAARLDRHAGLL